MTWQPFVGTPADWDNLVIRLGARTPFQLSAWARFRETFGWQTRRLASDDGLGAVQFLTRSVGPLGVAWAAGGPVGTSSADSLRELPTAVEHAVGRRMLYTRIADHHPFSNTRDEVLRQAGWSRPHRDIVTNQTLVRQLVLTGSSLSGDYSSNWSRNLRRGQQRNISADVWASPDLDAVARLHRDVENSKKSFNADWRAQTEALCNVVSCFGNRLLLVRACNPAGEVMAIRAAIIVGAHAFDFLAATSAEGRRCYASNVAMHALLVAVSHRGATSYDFGGVDPRTNKGVFDFKHGAGGLEHRYVGEFEITSPRAIRPVLSKLMALRLSA
ncbi:MAG: lipid II:glycine glycyltransferase FemX [Actinomycetota bacterium]